MLLLITLGIFVCLVLMAAPASTTRQAPSGRMLTDGHPTKIAFERDPDISFWEKTITPPGVDGGEPVDTTTMHNTTWRTMTSKQLRTLTAVQISVAYDPVVYNQIVQLINIESSITVRFSDGSTLDFFGYLKSFEPQNIQEGAQPEATISIVPTNFDPANSVEAGPVLTEVAGT